MPAAGVIEVRWMRTLRSGVLDGGAVRGLSAWLCEEQAANALQEGGQDLTWFTPYTAGKNHLRARGKKHILYLIRFDSDCAVPLSEKRKWHLGSTKQEPVASR